jgi:hypothetical protein
MTSAAITPSPLHPSRDRPPTASQLQPLDDAGALLAATHDPLESQMNPPTQSVTLVHLFSHAPALQMYGEQSVFVPFTSCAVWASAQTADWTQVFEALQMNPFAQSDIVVHVVLHALPLHPKPPHDVDSRFTVGVHVPAPVATLTLATPASLSHDATAQVLFVAHSLHAPGIAQSACRSHAPFFPIGVSQTPCALQNSPRQSLSLVHAVGHARWTPSHRMPLLPSGTHAPFVPLLPAPRAMHVPTWPGDVQVAQPPVQAWSQQTPFDTNPDRHSTLLPDITPSLNVHVPLALQLDCAWQLVAPVEHVAAHVSGSAPLVIEVHVPGVAEQVSHAPVHRVLQQ